MEVECFNCGRKEEGPAWQVNRLEARLLKKMNIINIDGYACWGCIKDLQRKYSQMKFSTGCEKCSKIETLYEFAENAEDELPVLWCVNCINDACKNAKQEEIKYEIIG